MIRNKPMKRGGRLRQRANDPFAAIERRLDDLWRDAILAKAGRKSSTHDACHVIGRTHKASRWDLGNGIALTRNAHQYYHSHPAVFEERMRLQLGNEAYDALVLASNRTFIPTPADYEQIEAELRQAIQQGGGTVR